MDSDFHCGNAAQCCGGRRHREAASRSHSADDPLRRASMVMMRARKLIEMPVCSLTIISSAGLDEALPPLPSGFLPICGSAGGFPKLIYDLYLRAELRDDRIVDRLSREQIDVKLRLAPVYCECFSGTPIDHTATVEEMCSRRSTPVVITRPGNKQQVGLREY